MLKWQNELGTYLMGRSHRHGNRQGLFGCDDRPLLWPKHATIERLSCSSLEEPQAENHSTSCSVKKMTVMHVVR